MRNTNQIKLAMPIIKILFLSIIMTLNLAAYAYVTYDGDNRYSPIASIDSRNIAVGQSIVVATDYSNRFYVRDDTPSNIDGGYMNCGNSSRGMSGYNINTGNQDYVLQMYYGNNIIQCSTNSSSFYSDLVHNNHSFNVTPMQFKLVRVANTGDSSPIQYPSFQMCMRGDKPDPTGTCWIGHNNSLTRYYPDRYSTNVITNTLPVITSDGGGKNNGFGNATLYVINGTTSVTNVESYDTEDGIETNLHYALSGIDASQFSIDNHGNLSFNASTDYNHPSDNNHDNEYDIVVSVTDTDGGQDQQKIKAIVIADTDGDGIYDNIDIDDDNDGILDSFENPSCVTNYKMTDLTFSGNAISSRTKNTITPVGSNCWRTSYSNEELSLPIHLEYTVTDSIIAMLGLHSTTKAKSTSWNDNAEKFYPYNSSIYSYFAGISWVGGIHNNMIGDKYTIDIDKDGYLKAYINDTLQYEYQADKNNYNLVVNGYANGNLAGNFTNIVLTDNTTIEECPNSDLDNDGIVNSKDLDSDNDGIPDAVEAQATNKYIALSGVDGNHNGLDDSYNMNGTIPVDTDGDGIIDVWDSDSDDDNITDAVESGLTLTKIYGTNGLDLGAENSDNYTDPDGIAVNGTDFTLRDTDHDTDTKGSDANGTVRNFDYRDNAIEAVQVPEVDLIDGTDVNETNATTVLTNDATPEINGTCEVGDTVTVQIDGTDIQPDIVCTTEGTFSITPDENITDGEHNVTATQTNPDTNVTSPTSPVDYLTVDTVKPAPHTIDTVDGDDNDTVLTTDNTPEINGTCETDTKVTVYIDGEAITPTATCDENGTYSITPDTAIEDGEHNVTTTDVDAAGNIANAGPVALTINTTLPDYEVALYADPKVFLDDVTPVKVVITVAEMLRGINRDTLTYFLSTDENMELTFDTNMTTLAGYNLNNAQWEMTQIFGGYLLKYVGNNGVFPEFGLQRIGLGGAYTPIANSKGLFKVEVELYSANTGDTNATNNKDSDTVIAK